MPPNPSTPRLTGIQWLICVIAVIGFAFDSFVLLMLPLILRPAIEQLGGLTFGSPGYTHWRDLMFYVPAVAGGVLGLLGGYLTDRLGRRRVLTWSILIYAGSAFALGIRDVAGDAADPPHDCLYWRLCGVRGGGGVAGRVVSRSQEARVDHRVHTGVLFARRLPGESDRARIAQTAQSLPAIYGGHDNWRYLLIAGLIPAIPLIVIRPFLPESPVWKEKKAAGTLRRPSLGAILQAEFRQTSLVSALIFACSLGAAFGAIQQLPQIVPSLVKVDAKLRGPQRQAAIQGEVAKVQTFQEAGGLAGRFVLAFLAVRIVSRRKLLRIFQVPGLIIVPLVFCFPAVSDLPMLKWGIFLAGFCTVAQLSFWGNYLPRVYPTHLRGTGESFAANIGGRMVGTSAALLTTQFAKSMPGAVPATKLAYAAGAVAFLVYAIGFLASFWLPEPAQENLPD